MSDEMISGSETPESPSKSPMKNPFFLAFIAFDFLIVAMIVWFFAVVPTGEIKSLEDGYVQHIYSKKNVSYKIVSKRPKKWVTLKKMNYTAIHAIVVSEDWAFYQHSGFDLGQIKEASVDAMNGERARGASTISQQLVKNLFLSFDRSLYRKVKELVYATYMERNVSKEKILEIYLNIIEFGEGLYGIGEASRFYFKKSPKNLTPKEGAFLAMLLPNPKRYSESFRKKGLTDYANETVNKILKKMVVAKYLKEEQLEHLKMAKLSFERPGSTPAIQGRSAATKGHKKAGKRRSAAKKGLSDGSEYEDRRKVDQDLILDDNPTFDDDAIIEDASGMEEEFNVE